MHKGKSQIIVFSRKVKNKYFGNEKHITGYCTQLKDNNACYTVYKQYQHAKNIQRNTQITQMNQVKLYTKVSS
jgi:hypothetical protein